MIKCLYYFLGGSVGANLWLCDKLKPPKAILKNETATFAKFKTSVCNYNVKTTDFENVETRVCVDFEKIEIDAKEFESRNGMIEKIEIKKF